MILQWILSSCILILGVAALGKLLERHVSARLRYALWLIVLVRLLVPAQLFPMDMDFISQPKLPEIFEEKIIYVVPTDSAPVEDAAEIGTYITEDGQVGIATSAGYARLEGNGEIVVRYLDKVSPAQLLGIIWMTGSLAMLLVVAVSNLRFSRRLRRMRSPVEVGERKLPLYRVDGLSSPCLFGLLRPAIYVTGEVLADEKALRHVLTHEETHFRHGDHIWSFLRSVALTVHWWNPLVWLAVAWSKRDGELACDESALKRLGDGERVAYGKTLLDLVTAPAKPTDIFHCATTMTGGVRSMKHRLERIVSKRKSLVSLSVAAVLAVTLLAACSFAAPADENAVSDEARRVIEVMMTAPNEDLICKKPDLVASGEGIVTYADSEEIIQNWENAIGEYFSEGLVIAGINSVTVNAFQTRWEVFGKEYAVVDMVRTFKDEKREEVDVTYTADGEEHHILVRLRINTDGKFYKVEYGIVDSPGTYFNILGPEEPDEVVK